MATDPHSLIFVIVKFADGHTESVEAFAYAGVKQTLQDLADEGVLNLTDITGWTEMAEGEEEKEVVADWHKTE